MKIFFRGHGGTGKSVPAAFSNHVHDNLPPPLKRLQKAARSALKDLRHPNPGRLSNQERADLLIMMQAMADPKKTVAIYFAMAEAMYRQMGQPLSDHELAEAKEISEGFQQERLTDEERQAVERLGNVQHMRIGAAGRGGITSDGLWGNCNLPNALWLQFQVHLSRASAGPSARL
jgi:hypothetical protein